MNRSFLPVLLLILLVLTGLATTQAGVLALAVPLFVYLLVAVLFAPEEPDLTVERFLSAERVLSGDEVTVTLALTNRGKRIEEVLIEDQLPAALEVTEGSPRRLVSLQAGETIRWSYRLRGRRGYYSLREVQVSVREYFGLVTLVRALPTIGQLFILPPVLRLRRVAIKPRRTRVYAGTIPARQGGPGVEFFDVRQYQAGDSPRWINWRVTARHTQEIYANDFEQERAADVGIILDGRRRTNEFGPRSIFEHSVLAAASLADAFLSNGNRVGLMFYGQHLTWTMPGYGKMQGERILHDLSRLETGDSPASSDLYVPRHLFPFRSQLVLVSPLTLEDYDTLTGLRLRGYQLLIVSPDSVRFEAAGMPPSRDNRLAARIARLQRLVLLRRLRGQGIQVVDWDVSQPFETVAKRALEKHMAVAAGGVP